MSFRTTVQPLVRSAAVRGASISEITSELRRAHGHAYRRADLLDDVRSHRSPIVPATAALESAITTTYRDVRGFIARVGVAAFSVSLVLPTLVHGGATDHMIVASSLDQMSARKDRITIPNAREVEPAAAPSLAPDPTAAPTVPPRGGGPGSASEASVPAPPVYVTMPNGMSGVVVTASWYGPGFYDNRLPCWQWLQANGQPIQLEPDTWGVANKTLPCGTMLTLSHGTSVVTVPVVDRGPYVAGRELDLSLRARTALGCTDLCTVVMHIGQ